MSVECSIRERGRSWGRNCEDVEIGGQSRWLYGLVNRLGASLSIVPTIRDVASTYAISFYQSDTRPPGPLASLHHIDATQPRSCIMNGLLMTLRRLRKPQREIEEEVSAKGEGRREERMAVRDGCPVVASSTSGIKHVRRSSIRPHSYHSQPLSPRSFAPNLLLMLARIRSQISLSRPSQISVIASQMFRELPFWERPASY